MAAKYQYNGVDISNIVGSGIDSNQGYDSFPGNVKSSILFYETFGTLSYQFKGTDIGNSRVTYYKDYNSTTNTAEAFPSWANHVRVILIGGGGGGGGGGGSQANNDSNNNDGNGGGGGGGGAGAVIVSDKIAIGGLTNFNITCGSGGNGGAGGSYGIQNDNNHIASDGSSGNDGGSTSFNTAYFQCNAPGGSGGQGGGSGINRSGGNGGSSPSQGNDSINTNNIGTRNYYNYITSNNDKSVSTSPVVYQVNNIYYNTRGKGEDGNSPYHWYDDTSVNGGYSTNYELILRNDALLSILYNSNNAFAKTLKIGTGGYGGRGSGRFNSNSYVQAGSQGSNGYNGFARVYFFPSS